MLVSLIMGWKSKRASNSKHSSEFQVDCEELKDAIFCSPSVRVSNSKGTIVEGQEGSGDTLSTASSGQNPRVQLDDVSQGNDKGEGFKEGTEPMKWTLLFATNREHSSKCTLMYVPPSLSNGVKVAKFQRAELCQVKSQWEFAIVGSVYGLIPRFHVIEAYALNRWKRLGLNSVHKVTENVFLFNFVDAPGQKKVPKGGPYTFNECLLLLKAC